MLTIRQAQMENIERDLVLPKYESTMLEYLRETHDEWSQDKSDETLKQWIGRSVKKAKSWGATEPAMYAPIIELMVEFGEDFDVDPACGWAKDVLEGSTQGAEKIELLVQAAVRSLEESEDAEDED